LILIENVPGFLTSRKGRDFADAAGDLASLSYRLDAFLVDAAHFVPQSRSRLFIVGRAADAFPRLGMAKAPESDVRPRRLLNAIKGIPLATGRGLSPLPPLPQRSIKLDDVIETGDKQDW
jgi:DNA (cytosine-5)-methyltransferase 1